MRAFLALILSALLLGCAGQPQASGLTDDENAALDAAIDDEYKARATYGRVLSDFGDVKPFSNIVQAEETHIAALEALYAKYGLSVPNDVWAGNVSGYPSLREACQAGVQAEKDNAALYDRLMDDVDNQDMLEVFGNLRRASRENHLPAFERCS